MTDSTLVPVRYYNVEGPLAGPEDKNPPGRYVFLPDLIYGAERVPDDVIRSALLWFFYKVALDAGSGNGCWEFDEDGTPHLKASGT